MKKLCVTLIAGMVLIGMNSISHAAIITDFDSGVEGWTSNYPSEISWSSTGGNPNGYIRFSDVSGGAAYIYAPSQYLGDWSSIDGTGYISFDHTILNIGVNPTYYPYQIVISGPGGEAEWVGATPSQTTPWQTINAPIVETEWTVSSGSWSELLLDVSNFAIRIELISNAEPTGPEGLDIAGIDNVQLSAIPIPGAFWLLGSGLLGLVGIRKKGMS